MSAVNDSAGRKVLFLAYLSLPQHPAHGGRITIREAAAMAGLHENTIQRWCVEDPDFRARMDQARAQAVDRAQAIAQAGVWALLAPALSRLAVQLHDDNIPATVHRSIALRILEHALGPQALSLNVQADPWGSLLAELRGQQQDEDDDEEHAGANQDTPNGQHNDSNDDSNNSTQHSTP